MKVYGIINGVFYVLYGLYGLLLPNRLASEVMGWTPDLLGLHQIRALWLVTAALGLICIRVALKGNLRVLTQTIILVTLCFLFGRVIGLILDGLGPQQTYVEIGIEIIWSAIGAFLLFRANTLQNPVR